MERGGAEEEAGEAVEAAEEGKPIFSPVVQSLLVLDYEPVYSFVRISSRYLRIVNVVPCVSPDITRPYK